MPATCDKRMCINCKFRQCPGTPADADKDCPVKYCEGRVEVVN